MGRLAWVGVVWVLSQGVNLLLPAVLRYYGYDPDKIADSAVGYLFGSSSSVTFADVQVWIFWVISFALLLVLAYPYRSIAINRGTLGVLWRLHKPRWFHPTLALDHLTDAKVRTERDTRLDARRRMSDQLHILEQQLQGAIWNETKPESERVKIPRDAIDALHQHIWELRGKKENADSEVEIYSDAVLGDLYKGLLSGKLKAKGFAAPHVHGKPEIEIPSAEWRFLTFDKEMDSASGNGISYTSVLIRRA